jgi:hypothetical protein
MFKALIFTFLALLSAGGQGTSPYEDPGRELLNRTASITLQNQTILEVVIQLSNQSGLAFSYESPLKATVAAPDVSVERKITLDSGPTKISVLLDTVCKLDPRFTWSRDETTINIFPKKTVGDSRYLMNRTIPEVNFTNTPDGMHAVFVAVGHLPPPKEQIAVSQMGGNISFSSPWTERIAGLTLRQTLNRIARRIDPRQGWIFGGSSEFRTISFRLPQKL